MSAKIMNLKDILADENFKDKLVDISFEDGLKLLEELVQKVESGNLALDKSITSYERGVALVEHLRELLSGAEARLKILKKS